MALSLSEQLHGGFHFPPMSDTVGTLTFHSIYRVTLGGTVLRVAIFAPWQFRTTGVGHLRQPLLLAGVQWGTRTSC